LLAGWRRHLLALAAGAFLAVVGALGTHPASLAGRLLFWTVLLLVGSMCASVLGAISSRRLRIGESALRRWAVVTVGVAAPMSLFAWGWARLLFGPGAPADPIYFAWGALVTTAAMAALTIGLRTQGVATGGPVHDAPRSTVRLVERLPIQLRSAEIFAVSSEDHYSRIHTSVGSTLILLRLSDAIAELEGIEGAQIHRSWWVARHAVVGMKKAGHGITLVLKGGVEAPVSRPNRTAFRDSGWLAS
jgi:hypothetical protein